MSRARAFPLTFEQSNKRTELPLPFYLIALSCAHSPRGYEVFDPPLENIADAFSFVKQIPYSSNISKHLQ